MKLSARSFVQPITVSIEFPDHPGCLFARFQSDRGSLDTVVAAEGVDGSSLWRLRQTACGGGLARLVVPRFRLRVTSIRSETS